MDMSLAEQLVWAAVYAQELHAGQDSNEDSDLFLLRCAGLASNAIENMRASFKCAARNEGLKKILGRVAFDHLRQMTFKPED